MTSNIRIVATCYSNIADKLPLVVPCTVEDVGDGDKLYHVYPEDLAAHGCDVGVCKQPYPFYEDEVEVITTGVNHE